MGSKIPCWCFQQAADFFKQAANFFKQAGHFFKQAADFLSMLLKKLSSFGGCGKFFLAKKVKEGQKQWSLDDMVLYAHDVVLPLSVDLSLFLSSAHMTIALKTAFITCLGKVSLHRESKHQKCLLVNDTGTLPVLYPAHQTRE